MKSRTTVCPIGSSRAESSLVALAEQVSPSQLRPLLNLLQQHPLSQTATAASPSTSSSSSDNYPSPTIYDQRQYLQSEASRLSHQLEAQSSAQGSAWEKALERLIEERDFSSDDDSEDEEEEEEGRDGQQSVEGSLVYEVLKAGWEMDREEEMTETIEALREVCLTPRCYRSACFSFPQSRPQSTVLIDCRSFLSFIPSSSSS